MSLIAKIQQESLLQNKLQAQLAEMSYQSLNGTRQSARNFREGTLEIGKMNFTTPQDRINKEMVMDYQKTQQEKHSNVIDPVTGKPLLYDSTGLKDIANVEDELVKYTPIQFVPVGEAVTEEWIRFYQNKMKNLYDELENMSIIKLKRKKAHLANAHRLLLIAKQRVDDKHEDMLEVGGQIDIHKNKLQDIQDELDAMTASAVMTSSPGASKVERQLLREKSEEQANIAALVRHLRGVLATELVDAETEVIRSENAVSRFQVDVDDYIINYIASKEKEIEDKNLEMALAKANLKENQDEIQKVNNSNKDITRKYHLCTP
jgi:hypothetical protein